MNLQHLRYFLELAKWKNFRLTAEKCFISQPALSKAIKGLEMELGASLFYRSGNENTLTHYGEIFHYYVEKSLNILDDGTHQLHAVSEELANTIRISATYTSATQCVPISINEFSSKFPDVSFICTQDTSDNILKSINNMESDIGLISDYPIPMEMDYLEKVKILDYNGVVAVNKNHPLSDKESIDLSELIKFPYIGYSEKCDDFFTLDKFFNKHNLPYPKNVPLRCNTEVAAISAVQKGIGYAIISDTNFNQQMDIKCLPLKISGNLIKFPLYMVWRSDILSSTIVNAYKSYVLQAHHLGTIERFTSRMNHPAETD